MNFKVLKINDIMNMSSNPIVSATLPNGTLLQTDRGQKNPVIFEGYSASMVLGKTLSGPILPHNRVLSPPYSLDLLTTHFYYGFSNLLKLNRKYVSLLGIPNGVARML